jgi:hypothetical protein
MKKLRVIFLSMLLVAVSGNCFAQYVPPVHRGGNFQPEDSDLGKVRGTGGRGFFVSGSAGYGLHYGGMGGRLSVGYNKVGLSVAAGEFKGLPLALSLFPLKNMDDVNAEGLKINKHNLSGTGFAAGVDLYLHPDMYMNFSYFEMGKLYGHTPYRGFLYSSGGHIPVYAGFYIDLGLQIGLLTSKEIEIDGTKYGTMTELLGVSAGLGYKYTF